MDDPIKISNHLVIPLSELEFRFARSGGKGGQNVNKVETRVELLFDLKHSKSLSEMQRQRLLERLSGKLDSTGVLRIVAQESRSQWRNREIAIERFTRIIREVLKPVKKRIATKASRASKEARIGEKKRRSKILRLRRTEE